MAEVLVICRFVARKGKEDELRALLQSMLSPTHAEPGCKLYELYESDARGRFYLDEVWENQAALDQHMATPHFKRLEQTGGGIGRRTLRDQYRKKDSYRRGRGVKFAGYKS
jgi:quinol monooxygenase YgiN